MKPLFEKNIVDPKHHVEFDFEVKDFTLDFIFKITKFQPEEWYTYSGFSQTEFYKNDKLWDFDVFEVFLQSRPGERSIDHPYLEIQISPKDQGLALWIIEPRKVAATPLSKQFDYWTNTSDDLWEGRLSIPIKNDFFEHSNFYAGVFACLGKQREHYCHHKVQMEKLDFHRPDLFFKVEKDGKN